jgi:hypothetical protein
VDGRVILCGELAERHEAERLLAESLPSVHVDSVGPAWELPDRASHGNFDLVLLLKGRIADHLERLEAIRALRRRGFRGRILAAGAFLTEKQDALAAGADYVFDSEQQPVEKVVRTALRRPVVAADHPYLRGLTVGEWAEAVTFNGVLPEEAPDLVLVSMASHGESSFWGAMADYRAKHPKVRWVLVDDGALGEVQAEALATGIQPLIVLEEEGIRGLQGTVLSMLRQIWTEALFDA